MGRGKKNQKVPSSQEEQEQEVEEVYDDEEDDEDGYLDDQVDEQLDEERDQKLLEQIKVKASQVTESQQFTWNAIYALKQQEIQLNHKLDAEIQAIKPLYKQISNVALGVKVETKLYKPQGLPCRGDPNKLQPQPIPNFWAEIFDKQGLLNHEVDVNCLKNLKEFTCQMIDPRTNHIKIIFKFTQATSYFSNLELGVEIKDDIVKNEPIREIKSQIKYKSEKIQVSIFSMLFDSASSVQQAYNLAHELYHDYSNAIFFYFREPEDYQQGDDQQNQNEDQDEEDQDDDEEEVEAVKQPKKKRKNEPNQKKAALQKPQCKQQ